MGRCAFVFFNDTAATEFYPLSLHDALPIFNAYEEAADALDRATRYAAGDPKAWYLLGLSLEGKPDRKSTRLNSSYSSTSYAVFCLQNKNSLLNMTTNALNAMLHGGKPLLQT